jgi:hypothetical protein
VFVVKSSRLNSRPVPRYARQDRTRRDQDRASADLKSVETS